MYFPSIFLLQIFGAWEGPIWIESCFGRVWIKFGLFWIRLNLALCCPGPLVSRCSRPVVWPWHTGQPSGLPCLRSIALGAVVGRPEPPAAAPGPAPLLPYPSTWTPTTDPPPHCAIWKGTARCCRAPFSVPPFSLWSTQCNTHFLE
jgi:hypothetical protein